MSDLITLMQAPVAAPPRPRPPAPPFAELVSTSNFSFLHGGSHPEELVNAAAHLGLNGFGLTDRNSFAGVVRGYVAARDMEPAPPAFAIWWACGCALPMAHPTSSPIPAPGWPMAGCASC
ncbi:PHP domain-containing protein [Devosia sp. J2-20]|uniref:PHP domain-containing protein n=1 Tax=Devosia sp. J2-20 TaxID=3026161 RepID=UPI00249A91F2|nr:PHP domain-containing protein [Devosia sp. J2-20]WDR00039.1 PHP domain-containing protein [Devosia sp. J2-20]